MILCCPKCHKALSAPAPNEIHALLQRLQKTKPGCKYFLYCISCRLIFPQIEGIFFVLLKEGVEVHHLFSHGEWEQFLRTQR